MALDGRPVWISADPLAAPVRTTTDIPYGGMPVRFVTPGGLHEAQAVRMDANWESAPIWDAEGGAGPSAPILSAASAVSTGTTTASVQVTTSSDNGTLYWVVTTSSTAPSAAQVKLGQNHLGAAASASGSQAISTAGVKMASATGLTASTTYWAHFMHENATAQQSTVATSASFTTDAAAIVFTEHLSVSRASTGYAQTVAGTLTSFAANVLRITDKGLLVEESRTNLILRSQEFGDAAWTPNGTTITSNTQVAPDGTTTADTVTDTATTAAHLIGTAATVPNAAGDVSISVYAKAGTLSWIHIYFSGWANFNVSTGALGLKEASTTSRIEALANGWYRCTATRTLGASNGAVQIWLISSDIPQWAEYTGTGTGTVHLWGAQTENGANQTSYIPTTTAAVTRAADVVSIIGPSKTIINGATASAVVSTDIIATALQVRLLHTNASNLLYKSVSTWLNSHNGVTGLSRSDLTSAQTLASKYGIAWSPSGRSMTGQGLTVITDTAVLDTTGAATLGVYTGGLGDWVNAYIRSLKLWNSRLSDADLALETDGGSAVPPTIDIDLTEPSAVAAVWGLVGSTTIAAPVANVDFTGLAGYTEIRVLVRNVSSDTAGGYRAIQVSTNNGSTFLNSGGDYIEVSAAGAEASWSQIGLESSISGAGVVRSSETIISGWNLTAHKLVETRNQTGVHCYIIPTTSALNALRVCPSTVGPNLSAGSIYIFAR